MDNLGWWKKTRAVLLRGSELMIVVAILAGMAWAQHQEAFSFNGVTTGSRPEGSLIADSAGNLYGTASNGGAPPCSFTQEGCGAVFEFVPPQQAGGQWTEATLYSFAGPPDGLKPLGNLVFDQAGNLYGVTESGGVGCSQEGCGAVFELSPPSQPGGTWTERVLHSFTDLGGDGGAPIAGLLIDATGNLYGTTSGGGSGQFGAGTAFELSPPAQPGGDWVETILYNFGSYLGDGAGPGAIVFDSVGNLYGTTGGGGPGGCGPFGCGTVFELSPPPETGGAWTETLLHNFGSVPNDGYLPQAAALTLTPSGALLGTTPSGGLFQKGVVFALSPPSHSGAAWSYGLPYAFTGQLDGGFPYSSLTLLTGRSPVLYGTTSAYGGVYDQGTVFQLIPPPSPGAGWMLTTLYSFTGGNDGGKPMAGVLLRGFALYGTTLAGGRDNVGTAFQLNH